MLSADEQGGVQGPQGDLVEEAHAPVPWAEHRSMLQEARQVRAALQDARREVGVLREALGSGPYVIVKLPRGAMEDLAQGRDTVVTIGFGQGVTRHLVPSVMEMGMEAISRPVGGPRAPVDAVQDARPRQPHTPGGGEEAAEPQRRDTPRGWEPGTREGDGVH